MSDTRTYVTRLPATACENDDHAFAGQCDDECAWLVEAMSPSAPDDRVYSDYLGGTSSIDVSGCHGGPPMPEQFAVLDKGARAVVIVEDHPEGCMCSEGCPADPYNRTA